MPTNTIVRARINGDIKEEASAVLEAMGLTLSDAFRMLLVRVAREKALPFEPLTPNRETIEAMKAARRGELVNAGSVDNLIESLRADDSVHP
jgi:DNA-damage-inducible protein J